MSKSSNQAERARFGGFELDIRTGELFSIGTEGGEGPSPALLLREQPFRILRVLVERQGEIVSRTEIRQALWPTETHVDFDRSINVAMAILRKALSDDADHPQYIETLARRGYRLIAPVEWNHSSTSAQDSVVPRVETPPIIETHAGERGARRPDHPRKAIALGLSVLALTAVGYVSWQRSRDATAPPSTRIMLAVLPFENLTGDPNKEYLADGLTEATISHLGRLDPNQLGVIGRTSVMGYKYKDERLDQIGRDLSVQYVLENSLRQSGDHMRITSQLLQVSDQSQLWSRDYDYRAQDILKLQEDVAKAVAREIQLRLAAQPKTELARSQPVNPEAFDAYLKGYYFFERNTENDTEMARKYFERATRLDSSYALAWVGLSRVVKWQAMMAITPTDEGYRVARAAAERALALDPNLAVAHAQMGRIQQQIDFDLLGADASFRRAAQLEPGNPELVALAAASAAMLGRSAEALELAHRAVDMDPLSAGSVELLAQTEYLLGQLDEAAAHARKALEMMPDIWPGAILTSKIYLMQGRVQDALAEIARVRYAPTRACLHAIAYYRLGRKKESDAALNEVVAQYPGSAYQIAEAYASRNQPDEAFEWLERAYAQRNAGLIETRSDPLLKPLHNDPRYAAFLKKLNFP